MAILQKFTATISTDASVTGEIDLGRGEFDVFAVQLPSPADYAVTASVNVRIEAAAESGGTYHTVLFSNNPATATSGNQAWEAGVATSGLVICEALQFARYAKISTVRASTSAGVTATAAAEFVIIAKKYN